MPPFPLTPSQQAALDSLKDFIESEEKVFIIKGYAGTGKTTLVRIFIDVLREKKLIFHLLASTGRAAKILSNITEVSTSTVHSHIYKFQDFNQDLEESMKREAETGIDSTGQLYLTFALVPLLSEMNVEKQFYIVDEASMVADTPESYITQALFGSGRLLKDLLDYDTNGKFIFVGDHCQLPPVVRSSNQSFSPALSLEYLQKTFGVNGQECNLTEIMRQQEGSDIIRASNSIRYLYGNVPQVKWGKLPLKGYQNIKLYNDEASMLKEYIGMITDGNYNHATLVCYSNRRCNILTNLIRPALGKNTGFQVGDLLLITQNNLPTGLMNGDMVVVTQIAKTVSKRANLTFRKIGVQELFTKKTYSYPMIEELIYCNDVNLDQEQQKLLFKDFFIRMKKKKIKQKSPEFKSLMRTDSYLNALRCVFGYAITCHKSQGGEWEHIFLDIPRNITLNPTQGTYQWIYTAMTRAKVQLHLVNDFYIE